MVRARHSALLLALVACHRASGGAGDSGGAESAATGPPSSEATFSLPIAAARLKSGTVVVAGLVVSRGAIAVRSIGADRAILWTVDALSGISAGPNVELHVFPTGTGAAVVYRGRRGERPVTLAVFVDATGRVSAPAFEAGPGACATDGALAWIDRPSGGAAHVVGLPWERSVPVELLGVPADRDPAIFCGSKTVFAFGEGEQDTTVATQAAIAPAEPRGRAKTVMRDRDFSDEERQHDTFVVDDTLGIVRLGQSGSVSVREVGSEISPWRRLGTKLGEADDIVAVDGDSEVTSVVYTHDDGGLCDGPSAPSVHTLRAPRSSSPEASLELAPAACDAELGPFWTGSVGQGFVVAWVERAAVRPKDAPPISGYAYRTITSAGLRELHRVPRPSDEMVDAGCDKDRCYIVSLVRPPEVTEWRPEPVEVLVYP